ncbi:homoserine/homoserine lactone efflux protein [Sinobacterium caligoides]|uniref:Homoserine/homoserine lactone efflux protein n=1 Tax=Sinobacterium caligoides TaxID=933926 RepID=A0A3N2DZG9_9GAMM|nr:homoserine/homoserine lactone efflux protein [Sinobacterium caligoides]ROS05228.1 homoserine/homoserine lactone efflux protein [Sinobacterium caligoides]
MDFNVWVSFFLACMVLSLSPGAGAVNSMSNTMNYGFKMSFIANLGLQLGNAFNILVVGLGLGMLLAQSAFAFTVIKWMGVSYLIYLGYRKFTETTSFDLAEGQGRPSSVSSLLAQSFVVNVTNPKAIVFWVALLPQFLLPGRPQFPQVMTMGGTMIAVDMTVMMGYAWLASKLVKLIKNERHIRLQNRIFGSLFIAAGSLLAIASHH